MVRRVWEEYRVAGVVFTMKDCYTGNFGGFRR